MAEASSRNAVVTGAAGGMGRAITKALVESGRRVVLADRDPARLREFAAEMGDRTFPIELDITDAKAVDRLPELIPDAFKPIDILVNNAGHDIGGRTRFDAGAADDWSGIIQTNLIGLMRVTRSLLPGMVKRNAGHIVNISSINAVRIIPDMAAYSASKAGVHMFTETLRGELAETAIRVTEMQPGLTRTNIILTRYRGDREKEKDYFCLLYTSPSPRDRQKSRMPSSA